MEFKQDTIGDILNSEREMVLRGAEIYGDYFINASEFCDLLSTFLVSIEFDRYTFALFLSHIKKHSMLALFSSVRLHHVQAMLNLRQVLEAGACAVYAIANPDLKNFADITKDGLLNPSKELTKKRNEWLDKNYPIGSTAIKKLKESINTSAAHANIVYGSKSFKVDAERNKFDTHFFDMVDEDHVKIALWFVGNVVMGLMDLFYGVNKQLNVIKFSDDFVYRLKKLESQNLQLKKEMMKKPRFEPYLSM